jgi:hypothetical protein
VHLETLRLPPLCRGRAVLRGLKGWQEAWTSEKARWGARSSDRPTQNTRPIIASDWAKTWNQRSFGPPICRCEINVGFQFPPSFAGSSTYSGAFLMSELRDNRTFLTQMTKPLYLQSLRVVRRSLSLYIAARLAIPAVPGRS